MPGSTSLESLYYHPTEAAKRKRQLLNLPRETPQSKRAAYSQNLGEVATYINESTQKPNSLAGKATDQQHRKWFQDRLGSLQIKGYVNAPLLKVSQIVSVPASMGTNPFAGSGGSIRNSISRAGPVLIYPKITELMGQYGDANVGLYRTPIDLNPKDPFSIAFAHSLFDPANSQLAMQKRLKDQKENSDDLNTRLKRNNRYVYTETDSVLQKEYQKQQEMLRSAGDFPEQGPPDDDRNGDGGSAPVIVQAYGGGKAQKVDRHGNILIPDGYSLSNGGGRGQNYTNYSLYGFREMFSEKQVDKVQKANVTNGKNVSFLTPTNNQRSIQKTLGTDNAASVASDFKAVSYLITDEIEQPTGEWTGLHQKFMSSMKSTFNSPAHELEFYERFNNSFASSPSNPTGAIRDIGETQTGSFQMPVQTVRNTPGKTPGTPSRIQPSRAKKTAAAETSRMVEASKLARAYQNKIK